MSLSTVVSVFCDGCGQWVGEERTATEARAVAKASGWAVNLPGEGRARRDLCRKCARVAPDPHDP